jgi:hypothetical protein
MAFIHHPGITVYGWNMGQMVIKVLDYPSYTLFKRVVIDMQYFVNILNTVGHSGMPDWNWPGAWAGLRTYCRNLQCVIFVCNFRLAHQSCDLAEVSEDRKLKDAFDKGRRTLASLQRHGALKGVEMKVMKWV